MGARLSRRWVLRGAGAALALPALPSLLEPSTARAQASALLPNYVHFATHHGGLWQHSFYPQVAAPQTLVYAGRTIRRAPLPLTPGAPLSSVLSAPGLTPALTAKLNVIQGVDIPFYVGHHTGGHLGNFARNDGNAPDGRKAQVEANRRTIDQIMAFSPSFYPDLSRVRERALVLGSRLSYNFADPISRTGPLQEQPVTAPTAQALFDLLFPSTPVPGPKQLLVDRVADNYRRLLSNPRLSQADKDRVEQHVERVTELERRLSVPPPSTRPTPPGGPYASQTMQAICTQAPFALDPSSHAGFFQTQNDLIVAALTCGASRIAVLKVDPDFSTYAGNWHEDVAHHAIDTDGAKQAMITSAQQAFFANVLVDLAGKLDAVDAGDGRTLLDHTLAVWTQEFGVRTHEAQSLPIVTFGGAGGAVQTGQYLDYRNLDACFNPPDAEHRYPGLVWHQWLGTVLRAMGVPRAEWENPAVNGGYPDWKFANVTLQALTAAQAYPEDVWTVAGEDLPWLT
jgi:hypothetical protein